MKEYERACACCSWRYKPDGDGRYCGPCSRARDLSPKWAYARLVDMDWRERSGHDCASVIAYGQIESERRLADERRARWPDTQREEYEG